jgi:hypothetical protein
VGTESGQGEDKPVWNRAKGTRLGEQRNKKPRPEPGLPQSGDVGSEQI